MEAIVFIILQIFFATRTVLKIGEYSRIFPRFSWGIFGHVTCLDQSRASENIWWITINNYYSFKIFPRFWLVKTTRIIHHNQLLFTKFGKNLRHIESMTSEVEPSENYWTIDVKMTSKVQPAADYWTVDRENLGTGLYFISWAGKTKSEMAKLL